MIQPDIILMFVRVVWPQERKVFARIAEFQPKEMTSRDLGRK